MTHKKKKMVDMRSNRMTMLLLMTMALLSIYIVSDSGPKDKMDKMVGKVINSFPLPGPNPQGVVWDGNNLWVVDDETNKLYQLDPVKGKVILELAIPSLLGLNDMNLCGLTWNGSYLLVADCTSKTLYRVDPKERSAKVLINLLEVKRGQGIRSIAMKESPITGLAWDGACLWAAFAAGYSSSVYRIDLAAGTLIQHFFAPGPKPQGLAWDGNYLWILDSRNRVIYKFSAIGKWTGVSFPSPKGSPAGLAFDGKYLWNVDKETRMIYKIEVVREEAEKNQFKGGY
jgi:sugar lactone lactonase YvrE